MTEKLSLYQDYSREQIHDIFDPNSPFIKGAGKWGRTGIVSVPERDNDFVFMVTFGRSQGDHEFDEGIDFSGLLRWQSQPKQKFETPNVQKLISYNENTNSIYLFLRTKKGLPNTYLGKLKYIEHDKEREKPVHFIWQLLDWPIPEDVINRMGLVIEGDGGTEVVSGGPNPDIPEEGIESSALYKLSLSTPPDQLRDSKKKGISTRAFRAKKVKDRALQDANKKKLGDAGERLVLEFEMQSLREQGKEDLAAKVRHVAAIEGDGAGYDIESFYSDGRHKYIEVKTTKDSIATDFFISVNEVAFSASHRDSYCLYRVYNFDPNTMSGEHFVLEGSIEEHFDLTPIEYRVGNLSVADE